MMNEPKNILFQDIRPNWNVCPGEILDEYRKEMGWTKKELALRLGISEKHLIDIKKGKVSISFEMANRLGLVFSPPPAYWLRLEAIYQEQADYLKKTQELESEKEWLDVIPVKWLEEHNLIHTVPGAGQKVFECLKFFAVTSVSAWKEIFPKKGYILRAAKDRPADVGAVAALIRTLEIETDAARTEDFSLEKLRQAIPKLRQLTTIQSPAEFKPQIEKILSDCGIFISFMPFPPKASVYAITIKRRGSYAMAFSGRYQTDDQFWFSLFHEIGHIICGHNMENSSDAQEEEANIYASSVLVPNLNKYLDIPVTKERVLSISKEIGIAPGILVGQLQHCKKIKQNYSWANEMKVHYQKEEFFRKRSISV
jgi:addiction module HigA family antidote